MKVFTARTATSRVLLCRFLFFSVGAFLAFTPAVLRADTVKVPVIPEAASVGGGPSDSSATFTTRASTLTTELLNLLTGAQMRTLGRAAGDEFFTLDNNRSGSSGSSPALTFIDVARRGAALSVSHSTLPERDLISWTFVNSGSHYPSTGLARDEAVPVQTFLDGTASETADTHSHVNASTAGNSSHNPFVQGRGEFVLSIADNTKETGVSKALFSLAAKDDGKVSDSAVPEPRFPFLLLLAGILTVVLIYRRKPRTT
jgi:hypothetical protein